MQAPYIDEGKLRPQDEVDLQLFLDNRDRAEGLSGRGPPFFSGREAELSVFQRMLGAVGRGKRSDATYVVEGPPGAGKTALMAQCIGETAERAPTPDGGEWLPVLIDASDANAPEALGRAIDRAIAERLADRRGRPEFDQALADIEGIVAEARGDEDPRTALQAARLVRGMAESLPGTPLPDRKPLFGSLADNIRELVASTSGRAAQARVKAIFDRGVSITGFAVGPALEQPNPTIMDVIDSRGQDWLPYRIVLFMDEGQNIPQEGGRPYTLASIHQGTAGAPISLCVFGLPGTAAALSAVGISRTVAERMIRLGPLPQADCEKAVARCFARFRVVNAEGWKEAIVARCRNWPQHLAGYLVAAMSELKEHMARGGVCDAARASLAAAIADGDESRMRYYEQRAASLARRGDLEAARTLVPELRADGAVGKRKIHEILAAAEPGITRDEVRDFIQAAIHCGFLEHDVRQGAYRMPIPSFGAFLLNELPEPVPDAIGTLR